MNDRKTYALTRLHLTLLGGLLVLIISTPFLVNEGFSIFEEEVIESTIILLLICLSLSTFALYRREIRRKEQSVAQFTRHVGILNLQLEQINLLHNDIKEWSKTRGNLRHALSALADRVLGIVDAAWVVLRIIETKSGRTVTECARTRRRTDRFMPEISNHRLLEAAELDGCSVIGQDYLHLKTFCIVPVKQISGNQDLLIRVILDNLSLLYLVIGSIRG